MATSSSSLQDIDDVYEEVCSIASSTETADNLPGPGRLLGKVYSHLGVRLENELGRMAARLSRATAQIPPFRNNDSSQETISITISAESACDPPGLAEQLPIRPPFQDVDVIYEICSFASSNETVDNLPGPGRLLGNLYTFLGIRMESGLGRVAVRMGRGPTATAIKIQRLRDNRSLGYSSRRNKLKKGCNRLVRYMRSPALLTQEQALDHIIDLSIADDDLRDLLEESVSRTIASCNANSSVWWTLNISLQEKTQKVITAVGDSKIRHAIESAVFYRSEFERSGLGNDVYHTIARELTAYLTDPNYSFLVIRYFRIHLFHESHANHEWCTVMQYAVGSLDENQISAFEALIEWEEFDEILRQMKLNRHSYDKELLNIAFRNADMLPRSFEYVRREWVADLDSFDHDDFIQAQRQLHTFSRPFASSIPFDPSLYVEPSLVSLKRSMENPLDLALAAICSAAGVPNSHEVNAELSDAYASLARGIDSKDLPVQERAIANARVALTLDRYTRRNMLNAFMATSVSQTTTCISLVKDTERLCAPRREVSNPIVLFRHCDKNGKLVHLGENLRRKCNGECDAVEEHTLRYASNDTAELDIHICATTSLRDEHYPLIAGCKPDVEIVYIVEAHTDAIGHSVFVAIPDGICREQLSLKLYYLDGSEETVDSYLAEVPVLLYAPGAYSLTEYYSSQWEHSGGMDATGPYSWKFSRKLPDTRESADAAEGCESDDEKEVLWAEALIDHWDETCIL